MTTDYASDPRQCPEPCAVCRRTCGEHTTGNADGCKFRLKPLEEEVLKFLYYADGRHSGLAGLATGLKAKGFVFTDDELRAALAHLHAEGYIVTT